MLNIVLFGPPGAGKGTHAKMLAEKYELMHISTGEIFRDEIRKGSAIGLEVKDIISKGRLVPDELVLEVLKATFSKCFTCKGFIFDGFPRTIVQADDLDILLEAQGRPISKVVALKVPENELLRRLHSRAIKEGRDDDTEAVILERLNVYKQMTKPLKKFYKKQGKYVKIKGIGNVEEIFSQICHEIDALLIHSE